MILNNSPERQGLETTHLEQCPRLCSEIGPMKPSLLPYWPIYQDLNHLQPPHRTWNTWAEITDTDSSLYCVYLLPLLPLSLAQIILRFCFFQHFLLTVTSLQCLARDVREVGKQLTFLDSRVNFLSKGKRAFFPLNGKYFSYWPN